MKEFSSNLEINKEEGNIIISINPEIYDLNVIYTTCYSFLEKAFILIDGDPKFELLVELKPKDKIDPRNPEKNLEELGREFNNELIKYGFYKMQHQKSIGIKTLMLQRILAIDDSIANIYVEKRLAKELKEQEKLINEPKENNSKKKEKNKKTKESKNNQSNLKVKSK